MFSWQSLLFNLIISLVFLLIVAYYGYLLQQGLSVGGLVLSWNFNNDYIVTLLLPPLLVIATAIILTATGFTWLLPGLWLSSVFLLGWRGGLMLITQRTRTVRTKDWLLCGLGGIGLSYIVSRLIVYADSAMHLSPQTAATLVWVFGLVALLYVVHRVLPGRFSSDAALEQFYGRQYIKFYKKFGKLLQPEFKKDIMLQRVFFAILLTEDLNRPAIFRFFERLTFPFGFIGTTGIMQVMNKEKLTDEKSVILAQRLVKSYYEAAKQKRGSEYMQVHEIAYMYNDGDFYFELITKTYFMLVELDAKNGAIKSL